VDTVYCMQNFTPIGATVAEISVTGQRKKTVNLTRCAEKVTCSYSNEHVQCKEKAVFLQQLSFHTVPSENEVGYSFVVPFFES